MFCHKSKKTQNYGKTREFFRSYKTLEFLCRQSRELMNFPLIPFLIRWVEIEEHLSLLATNPNGILNTEYKNAQIRRGQYSSLIYTNFKWLFQNEALKKKFFIILPSCLSAFFSGTQMFFFMRLWFIYLILHMIICCHPFLRKSFIVDVCHLNSLRKSYRDQLLLGECYWVP